MMFLRYKKTKKATIAKAFLQPTAELIYTTIYFRNAQIIGNSNRTKYIFHERLIPAFK
ncbi:hypothetical protein SAMN05216323_10104 [Williamwhitmania taraxaci]|uniref:Uncharacterized protein n=1 Tax=Williamwhitmania taraxaci TaxID=1640674 RepID=A0A1G6HEI9_9BACT|nr:hypothetical protein SAMN05216323_10104 [Williamwhitmania taraxaci]